VQYLLKMAIEACPLTVNWCTEHFFCMSNGTHTNYFVISLISGIGKLIFMNGSNVIDKWLQSTSGHLTVDLNCPCIRSTIIDYDRFKWAYHDSKLAASSFSPCDSIIGTRGLILIRLRSSCKLSRIMFRSSYESYCS